MSQETDKSPNVAAPKTRTAGLRALFIGLYAIGALAFVAAAVELGARVLGVAPPLKIRYEKNAPDPVLPFRPIPNLTHTFDAPSKEYISEWRHNSLGYRDVEHEFAKPAGTFRIFAMGDSFAWGAGADYKDTFLVQLENKLNARAGGHPPVEIVKAGIYAYFPAAQRLLLEHDGARFAPDLVLLQFYPNDLAETAMGLDNIRPSDEGFLMTQDAKNLGRAGKWLYLNSHAARAALRPYLERKILERISLDPDEVYKTDGFYEPQWREIENELTKMKEICSRMGAAFALMYIPEKDLDRAGAEIPPARLTRWAAENNVAFIDLLPAMREAQAANPGAPLYWEEDGHCTPLGYQFIADELLEKMTSLNLIP